MATHAVGPGDPAARKLRVVGDGRRDIATRIGAYLFLGGAAITALGTVWPHPPELQEWGYWADVGLQLAAAAVVLTMPRAWARKPWVPAAIVIVGIAAVTIALYFNGERLGGPAVFNEFFYVWPAFYIGYFFKPRGMTALLVLIAVVYAAMLAVIGTHGSTAFSRWIVTVSVVSGAAVAMNVLRRSIDRLLERLREAARTDSLTMLLNRRGFDERFELELERSRRTGDPVGLLVGDLDRFKELNDRQGHPAGDMALALVGQTLALGCRKIDTIARIGGEEFAILLPATDCAGAQEAAERLRGEIAEVVDASGQELTISFGVAEFPMHGQIRHDLMHAADEALYAAKALGRDRSVISGSEEAGAAV